VIGLWSDERQEKIMSYKIIYALNFLTILGTGMVAGVFLAFSSFVMAGLGRLVPAQGISAMQSINITVINVLFMGILFGTAILSIVLAYGSLRQGLNSYVVLGAVLYCVGSILVTIVFNVPLNEALAAIDPTSTSAADFWQDYLRSWTNWNHVRGLAAIGACAIYVRALTILPLQ
jgi:uncharacterized membrane protein